MSKIITVQITTMEELLGTSSSNPEIHAEYIASKAPDALTMAEEVAAIGADEVERKAVTVFPRVDGMPVLYDYQIKGFFKDACSALRKVPASECSKIKAFKKDIDGLLFVAPRAIPIVFTGDIGRCERPLRASTPQGERVALASSESIPAGAIIEFDIKLLVDSMEGFVRECLDYGELRGLGQWRNSGKGRFHWKECD